MAIIEQITDIVNDAYNDAVGASDTIETLTTSALVSMGEEIRAGNKYDAFFKSLTNRIVETYFFIRAYEGSYRNILRDEHEYGAFVARVYYSGVQAVDNPAYNYNAVTGDFEQVSPYAVQNTVTVDEKLYGGKGTWSIEIIRPISQVKEAFLSLEKMASFIDGIYLYVENKYTVQAEAIVAAAANTGMAYALNNGLARNLLAEYNTNHVGHELTVATALENADFLKYACKEISRAKDNMRKMGVLFNGEGYETFTPDDKLVLEVNSEFEKNAEMYLYSDTFHDELVKLPMFESVPFWQTPGASFAFADTSKISIAHEEFATTENVDGEVTQGGIIAFVHDIDFVAAYFGDRRDWDMVNERSNVAIHGVQAVKGYAVDGHANSIVFYIEDTASNDNEGEGQGE